MKRPFFLVLLMTICVVLPLSAEEKPTLTVLDFSINSISEQDMNSIITFLSASLFDTGLYRVIDTAQRETILKELEFSNTGCTDESCQLEIGRLLSAEIIVTGDVAKVGNRYVFTARMIETETSETLSTAKAVYQSMDELIDSMTGFADTLTGAPDARPAADAVGEKPEDEAEEAAEAEMKQPMSGRSIAAWSTFGVGVAAAGIGGYVMYDALEYKSGSVDPALAAYNADVTDLGGQSVEEYYNSLWSTYLDVFDNFKGKALTGLIVTGAGILSIGVSVVLFLLPEKEEDLSFMILPRPGACSFQWRVKL